MFSTGRGCGHRNSMLPALQCSNQSERRTLREFCYTRFPGRTRGSARAAHPLDFPRRWLPEALESAAFWSQRAGVGTQDKGPVLGMPSGPRDACPYCSVASRQPSSPYQATHRRSLSFGPRPPVCLAKCIVACVLLGPAGPQQLSAFLSSPLHLPLLAVPLQVLTLQVNSLSLLHPE